VGGTVSGDDYDDGDDHYDEFKDNVAMGYINPDGSYREPPEPGFDALAEAEHSRQVHGGGPCDCPVPSPAEAQWPEPPGGYSDEPPF